ncbi:MAG: choice-of-anchor D domain-containing protein, partial [Candidatus Binataceae bacterium]
APSSSCTYDIKFVPAQGGTRTGTILVNVGNDPYSPRKVTAVGIGQWPTVTPINQNFGAVTVGDSGGGATFTVTNNEPQTLTFSAPAFGGSFPGDYSMFISSCGTTLTGKSSCFYTVLFKPGGTGTRDATFIVTGSPDGASPHTINLYGSGK